MTAFCLLLFQERLVAIWRWLLVFLVSFFALNVAFGQAGQPASGIQRVQVPSQDRAGGQPVPSGGGSRRRAALKRSTAPQAYL